MTNCTAEGIDICAHSVDRAQRNAQEYGSELKLTYSVQDASQMSLGKKFSHISIGASLGFFDNPSQAVQNMANHLEDGGYFLASPFYVTELIPNELRTEFRSVFGINPTNAPYKEVMAMYRGFQVLYEDRCSIYEETEDELEHYCDSVVNRAVQAHEAPELREAMFGRLLEIKRMSNLLRKYQSYSVLVLRLDKKTFPARYVELF